MAIAKVALDSARSYLNDTNKAIWRDEVLLPHLKEAFRDLQIILWANGIPVLKEKSAAIPVNAGVTSLTLPSDLVEPIWLKERNQGTTDQWVGMNETDFEPDIRQENTLIYWCWREEAIVFVGCTTDREVLLRYWKGLTPPVSENSLLGFIYAEVFLGPQAAQYAARSVGSTTLADECYEAAKLKLDIILRANIKGMQGMVTRRTPYRRLTRTRMLI